MDKAVGMVRNFLAAVGYLTAFLVLTFYGVTEYDLRNNPRQERVHSAAGQGLSVEEPNGSRVRRRGLGIPKLGEGVGVAGRGVQRK